MELPCRRAASTRRRRGRTCSPITARAAAGVVVAVLDTGVAFRNWNKFRKAPDFNRTHFVDPCDLVAGKLVGGRCTNLEPLDRNGHGTFIAGEIAESTNNGRGLTGLAYGASIMPVRILDGSGDGDAATISRGIRYAVNHGAKVINLSLEFDIDVRAADIPGHHQRDRCTRTAAGWWSSLPPGTRASMSSPIRRLTRA